MGVSRCYYRGYKSLQSTTVPQSTDERKRAPTQRRTNGRRTGGATPGGRVPGAYRSTPVRRPPITAPETTAGCGAWGLRWGPATSEGEGSWSGALAVMGAQLASRRRKRPSEQFHGRTGFSGSSLRETAKGSGPEKLRRRAVERGRIELPDSLFSASRLLISLN